MRRAEFLIFSFILLFSFSGFSQQTQEKIIWGTALSWQDFKGKPDFSVPHFASANTGISASFSWKNKNNQPQLQYVVYAIFNPYQSWIKPGKKSSQLLKHEQLHFDISELTARQFRKYLTQQNIKPEKIGDKVDRKNKALKRQNKRLQKRYDRQTKHGTHPKRQAKWEKKIHKKLKALEKYKNPKN